METLKQFINERIIIAERIKIDNIGYDFSEPFKINIPLTWTFVTEYLNDGNPETVKCDDWWCASISGKSTKLGETLVFYSGESEWMFYVCEDDIKFRRKVDWAAYGDEKMDPEKRYNKHLKNNFWDYGQEIATIPEFERMDVDPVVLEIIEAWREKNHI